MNKNIAKAFERVESMKANTQAELSEIAKALQDVAKAVSVAETKMSNATVTGDFEAYADAKAELQMIQDRGEMLRARHKALTETNGVTFEDCQDFWKEIRAEQEKALAEASEKLAPLITEARAIMNEAAETIRSGNDALTKWHNTCRKFTETDRPELDAVADIYFRNVLFTDSAMSKANRILNDNCFRILAKEDIPEMEQPAIRKVVDFGL